MFAWLAHRSACARARRATASSHWLPCPSGQLAQVLPALGCILYLPARQAGGAEDDPGGGLLAGHRELAPLLRTRGLHVASTVTAEGPREWIECVDEANRSLARLYLLPDTDYLAWDAMLAGAVPSAQQPPAAEGFRAVGAHLLSFAYRRLPGLAVLEGVGPGPVSALGRGIAAEIARQEAVGLASA